MMSVNETRMMKQTKTGVVMAIILMMTLVLSGCGETAANTRNGNGYRDGENGPVTLIVGFEGDAFNLDPHMSLNMTNVQVFAQAYDTLVRIDADGELVPVLATSWERADDYSYVFHLREGVLFHNGEEMTAYDVAFSIERGANSPAVVAIMGVFDPDNVEVIDRYTVRIGTHQHFAPLVETLTHPAASVLSQAAYEAGVDFENDIVGTGAFMMVDRVHGDSIEFEAFEDYHGGAVAVDRLLIRTFVEANSRMIALETGEIDIAILSRTNIPAIVANDQLQLVTRDNFQTFYIGMNVNNVPDVRVRRAINYAINTEEIHEVLLYSQGTPLNGPLTPEIFGYNPHLDGFDFNPALARELLAEAGYDEENPLVLTLVTNEFGDRLEWAQAAQANLAYVGVTLHITQYENPIFLEETANGNFDLFVLAWTTVTGDGDYGLFPLFHSSNHGAPGNRTFFANDRVDELLDLARNSFDEDVRMAAYFEVQEIINEEAPMVFLASGSVMMATRTNVHGLVPAPTSIPMFHTVYFGD
ncbi:MAG: ABC transporter substrate-binding protein [Turicibacter sp.]|nr:ABC transporter substrate-binding protein [Turicibacter sp.]